MSLENTFALYQNHRPICIGRYILGGTYKAYFLQIINIIPLMDVIAYGVLGLDERVDWGSCHANE